MTAARSENRRDAEDLTRGSRYNNAVMAHNADKVIVL